MYLAIWKIAQGAIAPTVLDAQLRVKPALQPRIYVSLRSTPTKARSPPLIPQRPRHRLPALALRLWLQKEGDKM